MEDIFYSIFAVIDCCDIFPIVPALLRGQGRKCQSVLHGVSISRQFFSNVSLFLHQDKAFYKISWVNAPPISSPMLRQPVPILLSLHNIYCFLPQQSMAHRQWMFLKAFHLQLGGINPTFPCFSNLLL